MIGKYNISTETMEQNLKAEIYLRFSSILSGKLRNYLNGILSFTCLSILVSEKLFHYCRTGCFDREDLIRL